MKKFTWVVFTNCDENHEDEFNDWYDRVHLPDVLRVPGVVGARRSVLSDLQMSMDEDGDLFLTNSKTIGAIHQYLAIYEIQSEDVISVLDEIRLRSQTELMPISPYLSEAYTILYQNIFKINPS